MITEKITISKEDYIKWASAANWKYYLHFEKGVISENFVFDIIYPFECELRLLTKKEIQEDFYRAHFYTYKDVQDEVDGQGPHGYVMWDILYMQDNLVKIIRYGRME